MMTGPPPGQTVLLLLLLRASSGGCQKDCTGVDCPELVNCLEERLEAGACCTTCLQKGCTCEGYQYYDCVHAGFNNGKVPEGQSYFVDFGSTECLCPVGGGRIGCHFMPCPEVPPNCVEVSEPADGCVTCQRIGCVHDNKKYEAGHSFHLEACQVCHCPTDGGQMICYPVPDCVRSNSNALHKSMPATPINNKPDGQPRRPIRPLTHPDRAQDRPPTGLHPDRAQDRRPTGLHPDRAQDRPPTGLHPDRAQDRRPTGLHPDRAQDRRPTGLHPDRAQDRPPTGLHPDRAQDRRPTGLHPDRAQDRRPTGLHPDRAQDRRPTGLHPDRAQDRPPTGLHLESSEDRQPIGIDPYISEDNLNRVVRERKVMPPVHPYSSQDKPPRLLIFRETEQDRSSYNRPPFSFNGPDVPPSFSSPELPPFPFNAPVPPGPLPKPYLPVFKPDRHMDEDMDEEYDYAPADTAEPPVDDVTSPTQSSVTSVSYFGTKAPLPRYGGHERGYDRGYDKPYDRSVSQHGNRGYDSKGKEELKERYGVLETTTDTIKHIDWSTEANRLGQTDSLGKTDRSTKIYRMRVAEKDRVKQTDKVGLIDSLGWTDSSEKKRFGETDSPEYQTTFSQLEDTAVETATTRSTSSNLQDATSSSSWKRPSESQKPPHLQEAGDLDDWDTWERRMDEEEEGGEEEEEEKDVLLESTTSPGWQDLDKQGMTLREEIESKKVEEQRREENKEKTTPSNHVKAAVIREPGSHKASVEYSTTSPRIHEEHTFRNTTPGQPGHQSISATTSPRVHQDHTSGTKPLHYMTQKPYHTTPREPKPMEDQTTYFRLPDHKNHITTYPRPLDHQPIRTTTPREPEVITDRTTTSRQAEHHNLNTNPDHNTLTRILGSHAIRTTTPRVPEHHSTQMKPDNHTLIGQSEAHHPASRPPHNHNIPLRVRFSATSQPLLRVSADLGKEEERESFPVFHSKTQKAGLTSVEEVGNCCEVGRRWASEKQHCNNMPVLKEDKHSVCSISQQQCCRGVLKETSCLAGMTAARGGDSCHPDQGNQCAADSYQVCCSCCALGMALRSEGRGCDAHQYLGYPCGHVLLTCCEEEELSQNPPRPGPDPLTETVSDRTFPEDTLSVLNPGGDQPADREEQQQDVDECQLYQGTLCHHTCVNTWGSFHCSCHHGYTLMQDLHTCSPVSLEEVNGLGEKRVMPTEDPATHLSHAEDDQLPCAGNGPCMQQCSEVGGHARCSCFPGFFLKADGHSCEDENECVTNSHICQNSERCVNTLGSFVCERKSPCPVGYQLRNEVCEDIDECVVRSHNCDRGFECQNTEGSFLCKPKQTCLTGFTQDSHGNCIDVNECSTLLEPCSAGFNCINNVGSYTCQRKAIMCSQGYHSSPDGTHCIDLDECLTGVHGCDEGQVCYNLPGSFRCDCQTGYQYDATRQRCSDVNECWLYPGRLCAQKCENTPGSYQCSCTAGFSLAFDGKNCEDMNECDSSPCDQECANIYGSYQCYCRQGFYLKEDGHSCGDIDECSQSIGNLCAFKCVNVPGSYQCACPPKGFTMSTNGRTCRDIDECATGGHNCSSSQSCYNVQGSYKCLSFSCPLNYRKVSDMRCERSSCPAHSLDCQSTPLRITYHQLSFQTNIIIPAQIFRIGPSPAHSGDNIAISIIRGNEENYFSTRKLNSFMGAVYLQRQVREPRDFLIDVEMKLLRQGALTSFLARIYVFITANML
uniref:Fibulin 2 n=1 Tax=Esox lucius TaxID=8010 RepID=A0A6Q2X8X7_ESOLU